MDAISYMNIKFCQSPCEERDFNSPVFVIFFLYSLVHGILCSVKRHLSASLTVEVLGVMFSQTVIVLEDHSYML